MKKYGRNKMYRLRRLIFIIGIIVIPLLFHWAFSHIFDNSFFISDSILIDWMTGFTSFIYFIIFTIISYYGIIAILNLFGWILGFKKVEYYSLIKIFANIRDWFVCFLSDNTVKKDDPSVKKVSDNFLEDFEDFHDDDKW